MLGFRHWIQKTIAKGIHITDEATDITANILGIVLENKARPYT